MGTAVLEAPLEVPSGARIVPTGDIGGPGPDDMPRSVWLEARRGGIGGSDASAICGVNKYTSPLQVWLPKVGEQAGYTVPDDGDLAERNDAVLMGILLEDVIADRLLPIKHPELTVVKPRAMYWDTKSTFPRYANPDRFVFDPEVGWCPLEVKTCSTYVADDWSIDGQPADHALVQGVHYCAVLGFEYFWAIVLIGGQIPKIMRVKVDPQFAADVTELERRFWVDHIETLRPPPAVEVDIPTLSVLFAGSEGETFLPVEAEDLYEEYVAAGEAETEAKAAKARARARLDQMLGNNKVGTVNGRKMVSRSEFTKVSIPKDRLELLEYRHPDIYADFVVESPQRRLTVARNWANN